MKKVYHVNEHRGTEIIVYAEGDKQWLGDACYFWQDFEFAEEWVDYKKYKKGTDIYTVELDISLDGTDSQILDTVFNEEDYYQFVKKVEYFARKYEVKFKKKPTLQEFNNFIRDKGLWTDIIAIRFQDVPMNNRAYLRVEGFYYKKRIQIALFDVSKIIDYTIQTV